MDLVKKYRFLKYCDSTDPQKKPQRINQELESHRLYARNGKEKDKSITGIMSADLYQGSSF